MYVREKCCLTQNKIAHFYIIVYTCIQVYRKRSKSIETRIRTAIMFGKINRI